MILLQNLKKSKDENIIILNEKIVKLKHAISTKQIHKIDINKINKNKKIYSNNISELLSYLYRNLTNYYGNTKLNISFNDTLFLNISKDENFYTVSNVFYQTRNCFL